MAPPTFNGSGSSEETHKPSVLTPFHRPGPHLLPSHPSIEEVDRYVNVSKTFGSMRYEETPACRKYSTCDIHFPFVDLGASSTPPSPQSLQNVNGRSDFGVLTLKGLKALVTDVKVNQDRSFLLSPMEFNEEVSIPTGPDDFMMGLFDGHGPFGHGTSHFVSMELPTTILQNMKRRKKFVPSRHVTDSIKSAIKDAFVNVDQNIPYQDTSGSTGIVIMRIGSYLFLASTGDSQAFLVKADTSRAADTEGAVTIVQSTKPHKPDSPLEKARIEDAGGEIIPKMDYDSSSRVIIPLGQMGQMALAMSRCFGDAEGKESNLLIPDPNVDVIDLKELKQNGGKNDQYFVVVASDGMLDKIPPLTVAQKIAKSFYQEKPSRPLVACRTLIESSSELWLTAGMAERYRDDISIAVKKINM